MTALEPTAGQTVGPFFHYALPYAGDSELVPATRPDAVRLHGRVLDGAGVFEEQPLIMPAARMATVNIAHVKRIGVLFIFLIRSDLYYGFYPGFVCSLFVHHVDGLDDFRIDAVGVQAVFGQKQLRVTMSHDAVGHAHSDYPYFIR